MHGTVVNFFLKRSNFSSHQTAQLYPERLIRLVPRQESMAGEEIRRWFIVGLLLAMQILPACISGTGKL